METLNRTDSYAFWLLASLVPAGIVATLDYSIAEAVGTALVFSAVAYLYFNYPF